MNKKVLFFVRLYKKIQKDDISQIANQLTYNLILALFPFIIFCMAILGYLSIDTKMLFVNMEETVPKDVLELFNLFISEVIDVKSASLLSYSLLIAIFSASSGFEAVIKGINKIYNQKEGRNFIIVKLLSIGLVFIFTIAIIFSILLLIFGDIIKKYLLDIHIPEMTVKYGFGFTSQVVTLFILLACTIIIYKFASSERISIIRVFPGACVTVVLWVLSSKIFNIYINNFSKYSKIYGSIGSIFILMLWLNLISYFLLIGSEVNSIIKIKSDRRTKKYTC